MSYKQLEKSIGISALRKSRRRERLTQRRSGRSKVVAVCVVGPGLGDGGRWRRCAAEFECQQSHFVVDPLLNGQPHDIISDSLVPHESDLNECFYELL